MNLPVYSKEGKKTSKTVDLEKGVFECEINEHVVWLDIKAIRANGRQGTHATKGRSYVSGGGRKPFKQKGTGRARQGSTRAPHHVGGGRVFGPMPRDYSQKVNKKVKKIARRSVLSDKVKNDKLFIVEDFNFETPKTKQLLELVKAFKADDQKVLLLTAEHAANIVKSASNIYKFEVRENNTFSSYDILNAQYVLIQEGALPKISEVLL